MEIDHIYICTDYKAPAGDSLVEFGIQEGSPNTHPGQGTVNRRFYFQNFMIELLWIEDMKEVLSERTKPMRLYERCQKGEIDISPFGIALRPSLEEDNDINAIPTWDYYPIYLPEGIKIQVAENTPLSEPMYFYLPFARREKDALPSHGEPLEHKVPLNKLTSASVCVNQNVSLSEAACKLNDMGIIKVYSGEDSLLELEFDHGEKHQKHDFRPGLPLVIKY